MEKMHSNKISSAIKKGLFKIDLLNYWQHDTVNTEEFYTSGHKHFYEDRFQIDRTKLRMMMQTSKSFQNKTEADVYFENIMKSTETYIEWPRSYKTDSKCKQNPYVRVCGSRLEDVTWAKGLVLARLEVNNSFLRLKMAISNADHLYILGRNNNNINRIMDETKTHVQFPDSNQMKKENQVIVYGTLDDLENARVLLRSSSPLLMSFELPMNQTIPFVDKVGAYFKVQVILAASSKPNTSLVLIRGSVRTADKIKEATRSLLNSAFGKFASSTIVSVQLEIPPHHQESVKGENCTNIIEIMEQTNTKIFFPELPTRSYRKSQVIITGTIDEVCMARERLVESFPIELTFDIPEENGNATEIMDLGKRSGLSITISQKERKCGVTVTIKGAERFMKIIYEVHRRILKLEPILRYEKCMLKSLYNRKDTYKSEALGKRIEHLLERNDLEIEESSNERSISNDHFPAMSSPDSGYASQASYHGGSQLHQWTIFDHQNPYHINNSEHSDLIGLQSSCSPNFNYNHSNHETNNWVISGSGNQGMEANHHTSILRIQEYAETSPYTQQHKLLVHNPETEELSPIYHNQQYCGSNYVNKIESEDSSSSLLINSPLIVGSEKSVAERLICIGWGSFF